MNFLCQSVETLVEATFTFPRYFFQRLQSTRLTVSICYAPGLKGLSGTSSNRIVHLSVRNSVPLTNQVQYLKFGCWYSNQTWTVSSSMDCSHFTDITCPWGWGWVRILDLKIFAIFWLSCHWGASQFLKHMSCFYLIFKIFYFRFFFIPK